VTRRRWIWASLVVLLVAALVPGWLILEPILINDNERKASQALKTLASAQADFRGNDRDGNRIQDFWTGDVAGLYRFGLIPRELAEADGSPLEPLVPLPVPYHGYFFRVMQKDERGQPYQEDSDGSGKKIHNAAKFGFVALPARPGKTGNFFFIINEGNTIFRRPLGEPIPLKWPDQDDLLGTKITFEKAPLTPTKVVQDARLELARTTVTPHLLEPHLPGRSLLWCATFQLAWNELGDLIGHPVELSGHPAMAEGLNSRRVNRTHIDPEKCVALGGLIGSGIIEHIKEHMARRFPGVEVPDFHPGNSVDALVFAFLKCNLPFPVPLFRHHGISFQGKKVIAFGLWDGHGKKPADPQLAEVSVCDFRSPEDFVVELHSSTKGERLIVARVRPGRTLHETVTTVLARSAGRDSRMTEADDLIIPCVNFDLRRIYPELQVPFANRVGHIRDAVQTLKFRLDEEGAALESMAYSYSVLNGEPPKGRRMICDGPFLVMMARQGADLPYFAYWVENDELLVH